MNASLWPNRVLIVDDEADWVWLIRQRLALHQFECLTAGTGPEAWNVAKQEHPDVVILDLMLPGEHGLLVLRRMKSDLTLRGMKVVITTAMTNPQTRADALRLGADAYFEKPFRLADLVHTLERLLGRTPAPPPPPSTPSGSSGASSDADGRMILP